MKISSWLTLSAASSAAALLTSYGCNYLMRSLIAGVEPKVPDFILNFIAGNSDPALNTSEQTKINRQNLRENIKETIHLKTEKEGFDLVGRYYPSDEPSNLFLVLSHGCRSSGIGEFGDISERYHKRNYNMLIIDHRACGDSQGEYMGFGYYESQDAMLWLKYLNDRFGNDIKIFLHGISMGSATVLMMSNKDLPSNVKGIVADCSYTSAWDEFAYQLSTSFKMPVHPLLDMVNREAVKKAGYDFRDASPVNCVKQAKVPILFIHGACDDFVPTYMVNELYDACVSEKDKMIVPDAPHARSYQTHPEMYLEKVNAFIEKYR